MPTFSDMDAASQSLRTRCSLALEMYSPASQSMCVVAMSRRISQWLLLALK